MNDTRQPITGGLKLPTNMGVGATTESQVHSMWNTLDEVEEQLAAEGFSRVGQPNFGCPQITEEALTTADNKSYTTTYAQQLAWFNYSSQTLARASAELLQVKNEMDVIDARMRKIFRERMQTGGKDAKMSAKDIEGEILLDARYSYLMHRQQQLTQYKIELGTYAEGIERGLKVISRQVEIRKMEMEQTRVNIPGRGFGGPRTP